MSDEHSIEETAADDENVALGAAVDTDDHEAERPRLRLRWAEVRSLAPSLVFVSWVALVILVAAVRVDPWNKWNSWRRWLRADERGWELLIPGILMALAAWLFVRSHDRWADEGWSPEVVAMVLLATGAATGGILWGLFCLGLRPFAG